jgi:dUTP pyrophosphatase|tara:strand:- start:941 stop:1414 length:474 start_codon:yes stop_codon:yes gene_type:complete
MVFEKMILKMKVQNNEELQELYKNSYSNVSGDAGMDLFVPCSVTIPAKSMGFKIDHLISCEVSIQGSPASFYLYPRSSMGGKTPLRMSNSVGIIDSGYRGNLIGMVDNISDQDYTVEAGSRLFQICSPTLNNPIELNIVQELSETERGEGGIGSTGC